MGPMQYDTVGSLFVALGAMVALVLLCRWVFSTSDRDARAARSARRQAAALARHDYGLLVPIASARTEDDAQLLRVVLREAGIRGTVAQPDAQGVRAVLVFRNDADRARSLVS